MTSIFVCGITRDSANTFEHNYNTLSRGMGDTYQLCWYFYENDSHDDTPRLLEKLARHNPDFHFESDQLGAVKWPSLKLAPRAAYLCQCRNRYLHRLQTLDYRFDYVLVVDMDLQNIDTPEAIQTAIDLDADLVGANGRIKCPHLGHRYYDWWALDGCDARRLTALKHDSPPVPVTSCFGGMALYKTTSLKNLWYNPHALQYPNGEHGTLHLAMRQRQHTRMFICPQWVSWYDYEQIEREKMA
jgi:hypothetical protein